MTSLSPPSDQRKRPTTTAAGPPVTQQAGADRATTTRLLAGRPYGARMSALSSAASSQTRGIHYLEWGATEGAS